MHTAISALHAEIVAACRKYGVQRLDIFGSASRGDDFDPSKSDADFLVEFAPGAQTDPYLDLKDAFELILGRRIDLVDRNAIEASRNYIRRRHILSEAQTLYVA